MAHQSVCLQSGPHGVCCAMLLLVVDENAKRVPEAFHSCQSPGLKIEGKTDEECAAMLFKRKPFETSWWSSETCLNSVFEEKDFDFDYLSKNALIDKALKVRQSIHANSVVDCFFIKNSSKNEKFC